MKCPYCNYSETKVIETREADSGNIIRRRRECLKCDKRFTTYERIEGLDLFIIKKDGRREPFDRQKLKAGIMKACQKRPISQEYIDNIVDKIKGDLISLGSLEIRSSVVGQMVMDELKSLDKVAYIRFASVYREFTDITDFDKELRKLRNVVKENQLNNHE